MHIFRAPRRLLVIPALTLVLAGCGGTGNTAAAVSAASQVGAALGSQASALQVTATASIATSASSAATSSAITSSATTSASAPATSSAATSAGSATTASAAAAASGATTVLVKTDPKLGQYLTDPAGRTLYWYTKDTAGVSNCSGGCLKVWPAFVAAGSPTLPAGIPGTLTTITRADGSSQVAYDGMPLYYYAKDAAPGDTTGQGVGKIWYVVPPTAGPLTPPSA
jgi:predicted lipoprotein with Yx(FWY)xxD motif